MNNNDSITILNDSSDKNYEEKNDLKKEEKLIDDKYIQKLPDWDLVPPYQLLKRVVRK